jgi:hypothetical protein
MLAKSLYVLVAIVFLIAGTSVLLLGTGLLPDPVRELINGIADSNPNTLHILQEFGSLMVFAGLITFWFTVYYDQSLAFHWAITVFWGLFALVHWVDIHGVWHTGMGQVIQTIPFGMFVVVGLLRLGTEAPHRAPIAAAVTTAKGPQ